MAFAASDRRQPLLLALCAVAFFLVACAFWMALTRYGDTGIHWTPAATPYVERVAAIDPGSPAARADVRIDDLLDTRALTPTQRLRYFDGEAAGERVVLPIDRNGTRRFIALTPWSETKSAFWRADGWDQVLSIVGEAWQIFVAGLLLWRRPKNVEVQLLALVLVLPQLGVAIAPVVNNWISPWPWLDAALYTISFPIDFIGTAILASYALLFGRPIARVRIVASATTYAVAGLSGIVFIFGATGSWLGRIDWPTWFFNLPIPNIAVAVANTVLPFACAVFAMRAADTSERARVMWVVGSLAIDAVGSLFYTITSTLGVWTHAGVVVVDISVFLTPLGLTYAILSRRLVDVGFALNRATVFTMVSVLVLGSFSLVEWALGGWLQSASKTTNLLVAAGLAMGLGLSIHPIQRRVDRIVDGVFFRKRHEDESALRRFAREAAYTTDARIVVERTQAEVLEHTDCTFCDIVLEDEAGTYGAVDENDRALVALRATGAPVDLHAVTTGLRGDRAYPMFVRGRLLGAVVVGPKRSGESFAPDESAALAEVAHGVGVALDLLGSGRDAAVPRLIDAITALERRVRDLPDTLVTRLEHAPRTLQSEHQPDR